MSINSRHRLKQLFEDPSKLTASKFNELIDALWNRSGRYESAECMNGPANGSVFHHLSFRSDLPLYASTMIFEDMTVEWVN